MAGLTAMLGFSAFWFGACIASFLNVVIWRVPRGESIVSPPSHCPKCASPIKWYQNLPILSWIALRGRCANCKAPISPRYVFVETLGAVLFLAAFVQYAAPFISTNGARPAPPVTAMIELLTAWVWISLMIAGSFIDFDHRLLPDFVTVGGMILGVVSNGLASLYARTPAPVLVSFSGLVFGFGLLWLVRWFGSKAFRREAMGLGDVFLMGAVGALYGPVAVLTTLILSSLLGSVAGVGLIALSKAKFGRLPEIPYGPFICAGCLAWMFRGEELVGWYAGLFR